MRVVACLTAMAAVGDLGEHESATCGRQCPSMSSEGWVCRQIRDGNLPDRRGHVLAFSETPKVLSGAVAVCFAMQMEM